eukprot:3793070-Pyramimonas_sp.AAC.1
MADSRKICAASASQEETITRWCQRESRRPPRAMKRLVMQHRTARPRCTAQPHIRHCACSR